MGHRWCSQHSRVSWEILSIMQCWIPDPCVVTYSVYTAHTKPHPLFMHTAVPRSEATDALSRGAGTVPYTHRPFQRAFGKSWWQMDATTGPCGTYRSSPIDGHETKHSWNNRTLPENIKVDANSMRRLPCTRKKSYTVPQEQQLHTHHTTNDPSRKLTCDTL